MKYHCPTSRQDHAKTIDGKINRQVLRDIASGPFLTPGNEECDPVMASTSSGTQESYWDKQPEDE